MNDFEKKIIESKKDKNHPYRNELLEAYMPFVIKNVSKTTGRYISKENSDEFVVGLEAFNEAIDRYESSKGSFLNFAALIISSRVKDFIRGDKYYEIHTPMIDGEEFESNSASVFENYDLKLEINKFKQILNQFSIDLEDLVDEAPTHKKTRKETIVLSKKISKDKMIIDKMYSKKKLPMADIVFKFNTTKKKLKSHRKFIISVAIAFKENLKGIISYMDIGGESHE